MDFGDYILEKADMDNNVDNTGGNKDLAENGVVVTEAMIEAGEKYIRSWRLEDVYCDTELFVSELFYEMINADTKLGLAFANLK